jgi:hypothetical protein
MYVLIALCLAAGPPVAYPSPARVSGTFRDAKLADVFAEVRKQTGYRLEIDDNHGDHHLIKRTFTGTFRGATFWEVMDAICRQCGAQRGFFDPRKVYLWPAPAKGVASCCHGPFRLTATEVILSRHVVLTEADGGRHTQMKVVLDLAVEPRFGLRIGKETVKVADDDRKRSLVRGWEFWRAEDSWSSGDEVILYLNPPQAGAKRIALLKGRCASRCRPGGTRT